MHNYFQVLSFTTTDFRPHDAWPGTADDAATPFQRCVLFNKHVYNHERELIYMLWQPFWDSEVFGLKEFRAKKELNYLTIISMEGCPPYLKDFSGSAQERHEENLRIMEIIGRDKYYQTLRAQKSVHFKEAIATMYKDFNGLDVYYDDSVDLSLKQKPKSHSQSHFW